MSVKVTIVPARYFYGYARFRLEEDVIMSDTTVPKGYISDGASIPRSLTVLGLFIVLICCKYDYLSGVLAGSLLTVIPVTFPKINMYFKAAVVHDYQITENLKPRKEIDKDFRRNLKELGVSSWRYNSMYLAVRIWGILKGLYK